VYILAAGSTLDILMAARLARLHEVISVVGLSLPCSRNFDPIAGKHLLGGHRRGYIRPGVVFSGDLAATRDAGVCSTCRKFPEEEETMQSKCEQCRLRAYAERKPDSLLARIWRWHTGWCPGWKAYQKELAAAEGGEKS
jgi:hypothetical protein